MNRVCSLTIAAVTLSCSLIAAETTTTATATTPGVPGGVTITTTEAKGTVAAIDLATRKVTIKGEDGTERSLTVGPDAVNLPQVNVGDVVRLRVSEELAVSVMASSTEQDGAAAGVILAPEGAKPAGILVQATRVTATVTAIDTAKHTATITFADGTTRTVLVRPDIDLTKHKLGEKVQFTLTESVAVSVDKM